MVSIPHASQMLGRGVSTICDLIGGGKIRAVKSDDRTLVVIASLHEYANSLPAAQIAPPRNRKPQQRDGPGSQGTTPGPGLGEEIQPPSAPS